MKRSKRKKGKGIKGVLVLIIIILIVGAVYYIINEKKIKEEVKANTIKEIQNHYNNIVITNKETILYDKEEKEIGKLGNNIELTLEEEQITLDTKYFKITNLDEEYYIKYQDVEKKEEEIIYDNRYKNYIVFNENIITRDNTTFYDEEDNLVYEFNKSYDLPIIIKETDKYGVEFKDRLLYVKSEDVLEVKKNQNTDKRNSSGIGVLNYHAFYDETIPEERMSCTTEICHSKSQFKTHLDYFKENNILTVKMKEVEMYIDGKLQLPKSVLLTIDDGGQTKIAIDMLTEYKMYATIFVVTSWYEPSEINTTEYIELHSHSHNMHNTGTCPTGQGGGIQCLSETEIQNDLKTSREKLNNTTYFCYPFYEYNEYSIKTLKEAGFTMAFIGESFRSDNLVHVGSDKFRLRRFVIVTYTTMNDLKNYLGQIK